MLYGQRGCLDKVLISPAQITCAFVYV